MQAVILAGGLAARLGERTRAVPKVLLPIAGEPFLAWQLRALHGSGFRHVVLCIGHLGEQVRSYLADGAAFGMRVTYSEDGPHLLGTGGALCRARPWLDATFLVTYGDSYLPFDYSAPLRDLEAHPAAAGTMSVFRNDGAWDASNCAVDGALVTRYEKGARDPALAYIDYGAIALRREVVVARSDLAFGLDELQTELAARGKLRAVVAENRFYEIGSEHGIADLEARLSACRGLANAVDERAKPQA